eukprot:jgi/Psemu1/6856/gm1.6856_g
MELEVQPARPLLSHKRLEDPGGTLEGSYVYGGGRAFRGNTEGPGAISEFALKGQERNRMELEVQPARPLLSCKRLEEPGGTLEGPMNQQGAGGVKTDASGKAYLKESITCFPENMVKIIETLCLDVEKLDTTKPVAGQNPALPPGTGSSANSGGQRTTGKCKTSEGRHKGTASEYRHFTRAMVLEEEEPGELYTGVLCGMEEPKCNPFRRGTGDSHGLGGRRTTKAVHWGPMWGGRT